MTDTARLRRERNGVRERERGIERWCPPNMDDISAVGGVRKNKPSTYLETWDRMEIVIEWRVKALACPMAGDMTTGRDEVRLSSPPPHHLTIFDYTGNDISDMSPSPVEWKRWPKRSADDWRLERWSLTVTVDPIPAVRIDSCCLITSPPAAISKR